MCPAFVMLYIVTVKIAGFYKSGINNNAVCMMSITRLIAITGYIAEWVLCALSKFVKK